MDVATLVTNSLGDLADEGDHVVVGRALQLGDPVDVDPCTPFDRPDSRRGHQPMALDQRVQRSDLDTQHVLEARLVGPQRAHLRQRVARDHAATSAPGGAPSPITTPAPTV